MSLDNKLRNAINGGIKQTINDHGPITKELTGSATKRIFGNIIQIIKNGFKNENFDIREKQKV